jgi:hypothetical protein
VWLVGVDLRPTARLSACGLVLVEQVLAGAALSPASFTLDPDRAEAYVATGDVEVLVAHLHDLSTEYLEDASS